jgi:predicted nucleic acid-binding protein
LSALFFDTSALVKRYLLETGSHWTQSLIKSQPQPDLIISALTTVEMISVLSRREREGFITPANRITMQDDFLLHVQSEYVVVALDDRTLEQARILLGKYSLRALDALQLASAIRAARVFSPFPTFLSADTRLLTAAAAEGLPADDPNAHP